jgi:hypothetical protein
VVSVAVARGAHFVEVEMTRTGDALRVTLTDDGDTRARDLGEREFIDIADRVGALGGRIEAVLAERARLVVEVPCVS